MKKAFIFYFDDKISPVVVIDDSLSNAITCLSSESVERISRVDHIPFEVL